MPLTEEELAYLRGSNLSPPPPSWVQSALTGGKRMADIAANYYSGLTGNALSPAMEPIPIGELAKEAIRPGLTTEPGGYGKVGPREMIAGAVGDILDYGSDPLNYVGGGGGKGGASHAVINDIGDNVVFHGTPHDFEVPTLAKMGTGEGNQAYGPGFYTADQGEKIADRHYRQMLVRNNPVNQGALDALKAAGGDREKALQILDEELKYPHRGLFHFHEDIEPAKKLIQNKTEGGNLMAFKIPPPDKFIDYEKTLGDLPDEIKDVLPEANDARRYEDNYTKAMHDVEASLPYLKIHPNETKELQGMVDSFKSGIPLTEHSINPINDALDQNPEKSFLAPFYGPKINPISNAETWKDYDYIKSMIKDNLNNARYAPSLDMPLSSIVGGLPPETMNALVGKGVAGVKYPDAMSRTGVKTKPTFNYTLFNPEKDAQLIGKVSSPTPDDVQSLIRKALTGGYSIK